MKTHIHNLFLALALLAGIHQAAAQALTNIVVSPANPTIGVGSNQQFTATGYYNNGSSQVLTNASGTPSWSAVAGMPAAKNGAACAAVNGHLFVVSGAGGDPSVFDYNPASNVWSTKTPLPSNYAFAGATGIGNKLYFIGGCEFSDCSSSTANELLIYDTLTNVWTNGAAFQRRSLAGVGVITGKIYVTGGQNNAYIGQSALQIYDPASNLWTTAQSMPIGRLQCGVTVINGKLYVVGGYDGNPSAPFGSLVVYDPATDSWTTKTSMPTPRLGLGAAAVGGLLYAIDGVTASGTATNLVEVYNPATDSWSTGAPTLIAHDLAQPVTINGTIYLAGSSPQNNAITNVESYTPQNLIWSSSSPVVASINTNGVATGITNGVTTITATSGGISGNTTLAILSSLALLTNIVVSPATPIISAGSNRQFTATGYYNNGSFQILTNGSGGISLLWSSSSPSVASINTNGLASGLTAGVTMITATSSSVSNTTTLTVVSSPAITLQPTNNTVSPNGSVTLNVAATGGVLSYQWKLNGTNIAGANSASLTITNVSAVNIGVYTVIVNNAAGSVTSSSVTLASVDIKLFAGVIVNGPLGSNYLIQATGNLTNTSWTTLTNVALPTQPYVYIDYSSPTNRQQFYRAVPQ